MAKSYLEFSIVGNQTEEHFDNYNEAFDFCTELSNEEQMDVQFFSKEWNEMDKGQFEEGEVVIFKNKGEHF